MDEPQYLVIKKENGNISYWLPHYQGYTDKLSKAGIYSSVILEIAYTTHKSKKTLANKIENSKDGYYTVELSDYIDYLSDKVWRIRNE